MELLAAPFARHDQSGLFELLEVLHHAEACHREVVLELGEALTITAEQLVKQASPRRVGQRLEDQVHAQIICDLMVTCQACAVDAARHLDA